MIADSAEDAGERNVAGKDRQAASKIALAETLDHGPGIQVDRTGGVTRWRLFLYTLSLAVAYSLRIHHRALSCD
jgi:hypothetical protein